MINFFALLKFVLVKNFNFLLNNNAINYPK